MRLLNSFFRANVFNPNPTPAMEFLTPGTYSTELVYGTYTIEVAGCGGGLGGGLLVQSGGGYSGAGDKQTSTINITQKTQVDIYVSGWTGTDQTIQPNGYSQGTAGQTSVNGVKGGYGGSSSVIIIDGDIILEAHGGAGLWGIDIFPTSYPKGGNGSGGALSATYSSSSANAGNGLGGTRAMNRNGSSTLAGNGWVKISPII